MNQHLNINQSTNLPLMILQNLSHMFIQMHFITTRLNNINIVLSIALTRCTSIIMVLKIPIIHAILTSGILPSSTVINSCK